MNLDPELAPAAAALPHADIADPVAARAVLSAMVRDLAVEVPTEGLDVEDRRVPVPVRVYRPRHWRGAVLYLHGGGFVMGDLDTEHAAAARLAVGLGALVVSVDYRLAPEHPFPAGLEDCYTALCWLSGAPGVDPTRVAGAGSSAGGGLVAALALLARDRGGPPLCFQFLGIPELDDRLETPSMRRFVDTPLWSRGQAELSWRYYLGGAAEVSPYAAPARAADLSGLPPAYVSTAENDPLRDEGITYALRMLQAGVSVELHQFAGTFHGSTVVPSEVSRRQSGEMQVVLRRALNAGG